MSAYHASLKHKHLKEAMRQTLLEEAAEREACLRAATEHSPWLQRQKEQEEMEMQKEMTDGLEEDEDEEDKDDEAKCSTATRRARWKTRVRKKMIANCDEYFILEVDEWGMNQII